MQARKTILLVLLITASLSEVVKLTDFIRQSKRINDIPQIKLPVNCASVDSGDKCTACI